MDHTVWKVAKFDLNKIEQLKRMTNRNHHTEALLLGAEMLGATFLAKKIKLVAELHKLEGHLPSDLGKYRDSLYDALMQHAKAALNEDEFNAFHMSF